jgi:phage terminase large subunit-like protein
MNRDYSSIAKDYALNVTAGRVSACLYVRQSCQRFLNDLDIDGVEWFFSPDLATKACGFIELLPHTQGQWAKDRKRITLEPWQVFIVANIFGWVDSDGLRRFRYVYIEVPRKNVNSTLLAGIGLYMAFIEGEQGAQVYSAASTRDQAKIVWQEAHRMVSRLPKLQKAFQVEPLANAIVSHASASTFKPLSRDQGGNHDGLNVHCGLIDELHAHPNSQLLDVIESATGARQQPLIVSITTAGFDLYGVCYRERQTVIDFLAGSIEQDRYFGIIYTIDDGDDWADPKVWQKSNPNYGISVNPDMLEAACDKAKLQPTAQTNFLTKHLCVWVNARSAWMNMQDWAACGDSKLSPEQFTDCLLFVGLDLASKSDLAGKVRVFMRPIDGVAHYYVFSDQYLNEDAVQNGNRSYIAWQREGYLHVTEGNITDIGQIEDDLLDDHLNYQLKEVAYDQFNAVYIAQRLMAKDVSVVEVRMNVQHLSEPMKWIEVLVRSGRLHHANDPVLNWAMSNVTVKPDANENIFPRKDAIENKIDPAVALILAMSRAIHFDEVGDLDDDSGDFDDYLANIVSFRRK